jgi:hypothetical protein
VGGAQAKAGLAHHADHLVDLQPARDFAALAQGLARQELHHDVREPVLDPRSVDLHHVRALDLGERAHLTLEAALVVRVVARRVLKLDGNLPSLFVVLREPDRAHATMPELVRQAKAARDDQALGRSDERHGLSIG